MVAELRPPPDAWRRDGCGSECSLRMVIVPGLLGRQTLVLHDPDAHELYGRSLAGDRAADFILESGPLAFSRREMRIWVDGQEVTLTPKEFGIFLAILDGNGALVRHGEIIGRVWDDRSGHGGHLLRVNLSRMRDRLGAAAGLIETVGQLGYRFRFLPPGEIPSAPEVRYATLSQRGLWGKTVDRCRDCGTTERAHRARGYCNRCYRAMERSGGLDLAPADLDGAP